MSITKEKKLEIINKFKKDQNDTGSAGIQVAILTERIKNLTEHLKINKKDFYCRRGLLIMVAKRKSLLAYIKREEEQQYIDLIKELGLRK